MNKYIVWLLVGVAIGLGSCSDDADTGDNQAEQLLQEQQQTIENYLANNNINATREGDIFYEVITENASGNTPTRNDIIRIYYQIASLDGTVIDQRLAADSVPPVTYVFGTNNLILPVLDISIATMRTGEEYEFYLPTAASYLGYSLANTIAEDIIVRAQIQLVDIITATELRAEEDERIKTYLEENGLTDADSLSQGVYYFRTQEGVVDGAEVGNGSAVEVRYTGTLLDGTQFDSNINANNPLPFTIGAGRVIPGFEIGAAQMKLGEKGIIIMPSAQAYQESQLAFPVEIIDDLFDQRLIPSNIGSTIPPFSTLRVDIEVVSVD
ncbi:MAG: FKBP-type peptidyl-prolyl cis-trans isomerase [Bacteroidota bacterium]